MSNDYGPVSVWGSRTAQPEEVAALEEHWVELTAEDVQRQKRDVDRIRAMRQGSYAIEGNKFSPAPRFAALYRADGSMASVPIANYQYYLRKRDDSGGRIFFTRPPMEPPVPTSDPCPVKFGGKTCGKRMDDQFELIMHIISKHGRRAQFYLTQEQLDMARGGAIGRGKSYVADTPSTPPGRPIINPDAVDLTLALDEAYEAKEELSQPVPPPPLTLVDEATFIPVESKSKSRSKVGHTCKNNGRLGIYDDNCVRCQELMASKLEKTEVV